MNKTLLEISQTKNGGLSEVVVNWKNYTKETVILAISELRKRGIPFNDQLENLIAEFSESHQKSISELEQEFFQNNGVADYAEYSSSKINVLEKSDEERIDYERLLQLRASLIQQHEQKRANNDVLYGALWFFGGLIVTIASVASGKGGVIAYGAVIFGGIQFFRGLTKS